MSVPELLTETLDDEATVAQVPLGGEDVLVVTPTRTLVYRADGLLSDETVETYPHDAERVSLSVGRRKAKLTLEYGLDGTRTISVGARYSSDVLHPIMAGVINAAGVTEPGEAVLNTFRFSDLTLIITSNRLIKHIGSAVWTTDAEEFPYDALTDVDFEEGGVATTIVLTHNGRQERLKTPNEDARSVREALVGAVCSFHDVGSIEELRAHMAEQADDDETEDIDRFDFGDGPAPLSTHSGDKTRPNDDTSSDAVESTVVSPAETADTSVSESHSGDNSDNDIAADSLAETAETVDTAETAETTGKPANAASASVSADSSVESTEQVDDAIATQLAALSERIDTHEQQLDRQLELLETLIEELRRGR